MVLLVLLFLIVPIVELYVIIRVGSWLGALPTILLLLVISIVGAWLAKREGMGVFRRIQTQINQRQVPAGELVDAFLILLAGALLLTPGFITDVLAIFLLIPPTRALVRRVLRRRFMAKVQIFRGAASPGTPPNGRAVRPPDIDV